MTTTNAQLLRKLEEIRIDTTQMQKDVALLRANVMVEGEKPMPVRVAMLEEKVADLHAQATSLKDRRWQVWLALIGALFSLAVTFFGKR